MKAGAARAFGLAAGLAAAAVSQLAAATTSAQASGAGAPREPLALALARVEAGDLAGALALLEPLRGRPDAPATALALLGSVYLRADRPADALAVLTPLAEREDADPRLIYDAARAAGAVGRADLHRRLLERAAAHWPRSPAARDLGLLLAREGRSAEAYALLRPWALDNPGDLDARTAAALVAVRLGDSAGAGELLAGAPEADPRVRLLRATVLLAEGEPREALTVLAALLPVAPPEMAPDVRRMLGETHIRTGDPAAALTVLRDGDRRDPRTVLVAAEALYQLGELERALAALRPFADAVREHDGDFARMQATAGSVAHTYGKLLVAAARHEEAVAILERAVELAPAEPKAWQAYGQALMGLGRAEDSRQALARFAELVATAEKARDVDR